jgi:hypothetical protein
MIFSIPDGVVDLDPEPVGPQLNGFLDPDLQFF